MYPIVRSLLPIPLIVMCIAGIGYSIGHAAGFNVHGYELFIAAAVSIIAAEVSLFPPMMSRSGHVGNVSQASLIGTVMYLFLMVGLAALAWVSGLAGQYKVFLLWLLVFYWVTLIVFVMIVVRLIQQAAPATKAS